MKIKVLQNYAKLCYWTIFVLTIMLLYTGCNKERSFFDRTSIEIADLKYDFFDVSSTEDVEIIKLSRDLQAKDSIDRFSVDFIEKNGVPKWNKVIYKTGKKSNLPVRKNSVKKADSNRNNSNSENGGEQGVFLIPLHQYHLAKFNLI